LPNKRPHSTSKKFLQLNSKNSQLSLYDGISPLFDGVVGGVGKCVACSALIIERWVLSTKNRKTC